MLRVKVELVSDSRSVPLALALIGNISNLADTSDYGVFAIEAPDRLVDRDTFECRGVIERHPRKQTVWALVRKAAAWAASGGKPEQGDDDAGAVTDEEPE